MTNISLEECPWCNGSGSTTQDGYIFSTHYPCPDCEGTGFKYGKRAEKEWERQVEERWRKADELIDKYEKSKSHSEDIANQN